MIPISNLEAKLCHDHQVTLIGLCSSSPEPYIPVGSDLGEPQLV